MLPGKTYTIEDYLRIVWRRKWAIILPVLVVGAATALVVWQLPNQYRSTAVLEVMPQRVPSAYVQPTVTSTPEERLRSLTQQILSRTRLEEIVREFDLYREQRATGIMEDVITRMRERDITLSVPERGGEEGGASSFTISYVGDDADTVRRVTARIASLVIEENLKDRARLAEGTDEFLETQMQSARTRLIEQEKRLEEYRRRHAGELPSQVPSNLQVLQSSQLQLQSLQQALAQDRDRKFMIDRQLSDAAMMDPVVISPSGSGGAGGPGVELSAAQQLVVARANLAAAESRLTPAHPDVLKLRTTITQLEAKVEREALERPIGRETAPAQPVGPAEAARLSRIRDMRLESENLDRQIAQKLEQERRIAGVIEQYQRQLAAVPTRESELIELTRDHETLLSLYTSLLAKKENASMAMNMERRQIGEQFRIVDPPRLAERPFSPNRPQLYALGLAAGLAIGVVLMGFLEYRDKSLRTEADAVTVLALPVLAMVPSLTTAAERLREQQRRRTISAGAATSAVAVAAVTLWVLLR
jgi:polysaccharide chain length determinant protein (PEP-CTERM system associated)